MLIYEIVFYAFSLIMLGAAVAVITVRNPVYAALFLVLAFFSASAIWMLLEVEFLAIVLILVYVGAVMVLFLFVVMMLDINLEPLKAGFVKYLPVGIIVALLMAAEFMALIWARGRFGPEAFPVPESTPADYSNIGPILIFTTALSFAVPLLTIFAFRRQLDFRSSDYLELEDSPRKAREALSFA